MLVPIELDCNNRHNRNSAKRRNRKLDFMKARLLDLSRLGSANDQGLGGKEPRCSLPAVFVGKGKSKRASTANPANAHPSQHTFPE